MSKAWLMNQMIFQGYRVYRFRGNAPKFIYLQAIKLEEYPNLVFVKNKFPIP